MTGKASVCHQVQTIYTDHHGWLRNWLYKKLRCPHQADDLAHDTFYRLFSFLESRDLREPRAFLVTTASRLIIDASRRRKIEYAYLERCAALSLEEQFAPSAEEVAQMTETLLAIVRMLDGLNDKARQAFLMSRLEGLKHAEIAERLEVSVHSVKKYIAAAMVHCHRMVAADEG